MEKIKYLVAILTLIFAFQWSNGNSPVSINENSTSMYKTILKHNPAKKTGRPNAPSRSYIECFYGDGVVGFSFSGGVQSMEVRIYNGVNEYVGTTTADTPWIELPSLSGIYDIECTTDDGRVFSGVIEW